MNLVWAAKYNKTLESLKYKSAEGVRQIEQSVNLSGKRTGQEQFDYSRPVKYDWSFALFRTYQGNME